MLVKKEFRRKIGEINLILDLHKGDLVSTHWGLIVQKLSRKQLTQLKKFTLANIRAIN